MNFCERFLNQDYYNRYWNFYLDCMIGKDNRIRKNFSDFDKLMICSIKSDNDKNDEDKLNVNRNSIIKEYIIDLLLDIDSNGLPNGISIPSNLRFLKEILNDKEENKNLYFWAKNLLEKKLKIDEKSSNKFIICLACGALLAIFFISHDGNVIKSNNVDLKLANYILSSGEISNKKDEFYEAIFLSCVINRIKENPMTWLACMSKEVYIRILDERQKNKNSDDNKNKEQEEHRGGEPATGENKGENRLKLKETLKSIENNKLKEAFEILSDEKIEDLAIYKGTKYTIQIYYQYGKKFYDYVIEVFNDMTSNVNDNDVIHKIDVSIEKNCNMWQRFLNSIKEETEAISLFNDHSFHKETIKYTVLSYLTMALRTIDRDNKKYRATFDHIKKINNFCKEHLKSPVIYDIARLLDENKLDSFK